MAQVKVLVAEVDGIEKPYAEERLLNAIDTQFNNAGSSVVATNVEDAIKEISNTNSAARTIVFLDYAGGTANTGRYLEWYQGISSFDAPLETISGYDILSMIIRTTATSSTCSIGFYNISVPTSPVLLYTAVMSGVKKLTLNGSTLFTLVGGGALAVKIVSGSIVKPHIQMTLRGN